MAVTDSQLYFAVGVPTFAVLMGILVSALQMNTINARFTSLETRFDTLLGKVIEIDTRLTRVEERLERR
jgi:hypothetical protein